MHVLVFLLTQYWIKVYNAHKNVEKKKKSNKIKNDNVCRKNHCLLFLLLLVRAFLWRSLKHHIGIGKLLMPVCVCGCYCSSVSNGFLIKWNIYFWLFINDRGCNQNLIDNITNMKRNKSKRRSVRKIDKKNIK